MLFDRGRKAAIQYMHMPHEAIVSHAGLEAVLAEAQVGCLGTVGLDGQPYVTAHNFLYRDGCIYIHSALTGRKLDNISCDARVCFTAYVADRLVLGPRTCDCAMRYRSVIAIGRAVLVHDLERRRELLMALTERYAGQPVESPPAWRVAQTALIEIYIEELTGKRNYDRENPVNNDAACP
jgi:uncharacterized protein